MSQPTPSNQPEWTVTELAGALRRTLEDRFGQVRLRGELGKVSRHGSGHVYLDIKDEGACIAGVIWRNTAARLRVKLEQGMEVVATGRITTFPGQSKYQINIETIEPAGVGALMALLDERKRRLAAEGLFDAGRKRPLPFLPAVVGVITSPTGAVIRDVLHRLADRFPRRVLVWPVRVQGESCGAEVAAAIAGFGALPVDGPVPRPDVLIVARGGGSLEDLWGFSDEVVVRAAAASTMPLISAVGHETDWTLLDHAADMRAPTPTAAAEMAVPVRAELLARQGALAARLGEAVRRGLDGHRMALRAASRGLPSAEAVLAEKRQRLDLAGARLGPALLANARTGERQLRHLAERLARRSPGATLAGARTRLASVAARMPDAARRARQERHQALARLDERLRAGLGLAARAERDRIGRTGDRLRDLSRRSAAAVLAGLERRRALLDGKAGLLGSLGYRAVLSRGYALVRDGAGHPVASAGAVEPGQALLLTFADGDRRVLAEGGRPERGRRRPDAATALAQDSLFDM